MLASPVAPPVRPGGYIPCLLAARSGSRRHADGQCAVPVGELDVLGGRRKQRTLGAIDAGGDAVVAESAGAELRRRNLTGDSEGKDNRLQAVIGD